MDVDAALAALAHGEPYTLPGLGRFELVRASATTRRTVRFLAAPELIAALDGSRNADTALAAALLADGEAELIGVGKLVVVEGAVVLKPDRPFLRKVRLPAGGRRSRPTMDDLLFRDD